jgi:hypothetical protein
LSRIYPARIGCSNVRGNLREFGSNRWIDSMEPLSQLLSR